MTTVYITPQAQEAMLNLLTIAKSKKIEYGMELLLVGNEVFAGQWKRGAVTKVRASILSPDTVGWFHTHPFYILLSPRTYELFDWKKPVPKPPELSSVDILHIFVSPLHRIIGVGAPDYSERMVKFATIQKQVPRELKASILGMMPLIAATEMPENMDIWQYCGVYDFELGRSPVPIEVYLEKFWFEPPVFRTV